MKAKEELARLKALNLARATPEVWGVNIPEGASESERAEGERLIGVIAEYLKQFVPPSDCICCGKPLGAKDAIHGLLGGATFTWGIAHGEGFCSHCKYPARAMHYVKDGEGKPDLLTVRNFILQYHPDELTVEKPELETA